MREDARGRVIKMWNYIAGLGMKVTSYEYNSQNQLTKLEYQSESDTDYKRYIYFYDYAGRMLSVSTEESGSPPDYNYAFAVYKYNENSQVDSVFMNNFNQNLSYSFNNRNWITNCVNSSSIFGYSLDYALNGNVTNQTISGIYRNNFSNTKDVRSNFTYDKSNRLKKIEKYNSKYFDLTGDYSYDPDGNFTSLTRSYNSDNFSYDYYSGTNRLKKVTGSTDQFTYDYNGNQTNDYINNNTGIKYDHRNLITEFTRQDLNQDPPITDITRYKYDEAGNRIRKTIYRSNDSNPPPLPEENEDLPSGWSITKDEYYSRDASGKEIAVYQSYTLDYWNVWGTDNEGRIKSTGMKYFYLKDHLGSIRAVINQNNVLVEAQDYDPWGHVARSWDSTSADYKFTGKEHDKESSYDYFGARYYDSRIGRWGSVDPLFEKHIQWTPYNYVLGNPMMLIDPDGRQLVVTGGRNGQNDIGDFYNSLDIKGLNYNYGKVDFTGNYSKLDEDEKMIIDLVLEKSTFVDEKTNQKTTLTVEARLMEKDYYIYPEGTKNITNCESYEGSVYNDNGTATAIQYFHMGIINLLDDKGVFYKTDIVRHGIIEAIVGARKHLPYLEAHGAANEIAPAKPRSSYKGVFNKSGKLYAQPSNNDPPELIKELDLK